jgi:hypothetical protein
MFTDSPRGKKNLAAFRESDQTKTLDLPQDGKLITITRSIEIAMKAGAVPDVCHSARCFCAPCQIYKVPDAAFES